MSRPDRGRPDQDGVEPVAPESVRGADLRLVPIAAAAWAAMWIGTSGSGPVWLVGAALVLAIGIAAGDRRSRLLAATAWVLAIGMVVGGLHQYGMTSSPAHDLAADEAMVQAEVVVDADPRVQPGSGVKPPYLSVRGTVRELNGRGQSWRLRAPVLITVSGAEVERWTKINVGTRLRVQARLQSPMPGADFAALVRVRGPATVIARPGAGLQWVERVRSGLRAAVADRQPEQRALVPALVLGDTSAMTPELNADFETTGLTHLNAVSGANLTLLLAFMLLMARVIGVRGWWLRGVGLAGVIIFVALCRTEPSVLRAAAMGLVALAALGTGGGRRGLRNLSVAMVILLLIDPWLSRSIGFALSVLASAGIVWWAGRWTEIMHRWLPRIVAESVAVPLAAHLATLPVVAAISGRISVIGIMTNALAGPFVGPATVLGFAAAGLSLINGWLASLAGFGAAWSAQCILWVAHLGAGFPGAAWNWPTHPVALLILGVLAAAVGFGMRWALARPWLAAALALVMVLGFVRAPVQPGWPPRDWVLVACDVGQGDGLVVRVDHDQAVVVDVGPDPQLMDQCLDQLGVRAVPLLILTHFHADHVGGLPGVLDGRQVGEVWVSPMASPPVEAAGVAEELATPGTVVRTPVVGEQVQVGSTSWQVIGPVQGWSPTDQAGEEESGAENDASLVVMGSVAGLRVLLTGDVEPAGQQAILASQVDLRADVLKVPHHGSSRQDPDFMAATGARLAIASAGAGNDYGHPAPRTVQLLRSLGMTVLVTADNGAIAVTNTDGKLGSVTQR